MKKKVEKSLLLFCVKQYKNPRKYYKKINPRK